MEKKVKLKGRLALFYNWPIILIIIVFITSLIVSIFKKVVFPYFFLSIGFTLITIGISNKYVYMKEDMVKNNFISGILIIIFSLLKIFGVI